jgi:phosphohistidine phosphatase SixA
VLGDQRIDAVFVTNLIRTQQTGAPVAVTAGVTPQQYQAADPQSAVDTILADHIGGRVLAVGHSNTLDDIAAGLGPAYRTLARISSIGCSSSTSSPVSRILTSCATGRRRPKLLLFTQEVPP